jgi:hypothetical protein
LHTTYRQKIDRQRSGNAYNVRADPCVATESLFRLSRCTQGRDAGIPTVEAPHRGAPAAHRLYGVHT